MFKAVKDILVLSSKNNSKSHMAEAYLRHFARHRATVYSAGIERGLLHPLAIQVMTEDGIDISNHTSNLVDEYIDVDFDLILNVCNDAVLNNLPFQTKALTFQYNFPDPELSIGIEEEMLKDFRQTRDMIKSYCEKFLKIHLYSNSQSFYKG
jgi:arsenate reductase